MSFLLPVILALMVVASSAHKLTARKIIRQELHNRASSFSKRQTTVNITQNPQYGVNIRCVVSALLLSCAEQNPSSIYDLIYLATVSSAQLLKLYAYGLLDYCWRRQCVFYPRSCSSWSLNTITDYSVQLDTGSSDLFIKGATHPVPNANDETVSILTSFMSS